MSAIISFLLSGWGVPLEIVNGKVEVSAEIAYSITVEIVE